MLNLLKFIRRYLNLRCTASEAFVSHALVTHTFFFDSLDVRIFMVTIAIKKGLEICKHRFLILI